MTWALTFLMASGVAFSVLCTWSICTRHGLMQGKVLHRAYFTNAKMAKMFPTRCNACNRCKQSAADHLHMFWTCPGLTDFWSKIFKTLEQTLNTSIDPNPLTALFGIPPYQKMPLHTACHFLYHFVGYMLHPP